MKRIISLFLSFLMVATLLPYNVWAMELDENQVTGETKPVFEEPEEEIFEEEVPEEEILPEEEISEEPETEEKQIEEEVIEPEESEKLLASDVAYSGYCGGEGDGTNLTWTLDAEGTLTISGEGKMANYDRENVDGNYITTAPWGTYKSKLKKLVMEDGVTTIGNLAFYDCDGLSGNLVIPDSVTTIGSCAFYDCDGLSGNLVIPDSVTTIGSAAFSGCSGLTGTLTISNNVTIIEDSVFYGCNGFTGTLTIPSSVTTIGDCAFYMCDGFEGSLVIPDSVTYIGDHTFSDCNGFNGDLIIGDGVTTIDEYAFAWSNFDGNLILGKNVQYIYDCAFLDCSGLKGELFIPESVTWIEGYAFNGCGIDTYYFESNPYVNNQSALCPSFDMADNLYYNWEKTSWSLYGGKWNGYSNIFVYDSKEGKTTLKGKGYCGAEGDGKNLLWVVDENGVLTISGSGAMKNYSSSSGAWRGLNIKEIVVDATFTTIGDYAFYDCSGFELDQILQNTVTRIGNYAFYGCDGLTGTLTIPSSVTTIGNYAFSGCSGLTGTLTIPGSVTSLGGHAFSNCKGFTGFKLPNSITTIPYNCFYNCSGFTGTLTIPRSVTTIGNYAFQNCTGFSGNLSIPNSVTSIGDYAFQNCTGFNGTLTLPENLTSVSRYAFSNCSGFKGDLVIPEKVSYIYYNAFYGCSGFNGKLILSENLSYIYDNAFYGCSGFTGDLVIPGSTRYIEDMAFYGCNGFNGNLILNEGIYNIYASAFKNCSGFTGNLYIPSSVTSIGSNAFENCSGFDGKLVLPSKITSVSTGTFKNCSGLTGELVIHDNITNIYASAFSGCSGFESLKLGKNLKTIGEKAFENCTGLSGSVTFQEKVENIGASAFATCPVKEYYFKGEAPIVIAAEYDNRTFAADALLHYKGGFEYWTEPTYEGYNTTNTVFVEFNANGGVGAPANQNKVAGVDLTITSVIPARIGHTFLGWATTADAKTAEYQPGSTYSSDDSIVLYAIWQMNEGIIGAGYCGAEADGANISWVIDKNGVLTLAGKGVMASYTANHDGNTWRSSAPWNVYEEDIKEIVIGEGITSIGDYAFAYLFNIAEEITIPSDIKSVGQQAFIGTDAVYVIEGQPSLGWNMFSPWNSDRVSIYFMSGAPASIQSGTIGNNLTLYYLSGTEDKWTFDENGLWYGYTVHPYTTGEEVEFDPSLYVASGYCGNDPLIGSKNAIWTLDQNGTLTIKGKGEMADYKYAEDENGYSRTSAPWGDYEDNIKKLVIEEGITGIGSYAFFLMRFDSGYSIPKTAKTIGRQAFQSCRLNGELVLHEGIEKIDSWAFGNNNITAVTIPSTANYIVSEAFVGCASLENFKVSENNPNYCDIEGILCSKDGKTLMSYPCGRKGEVIIPESIEIIGNGAFTELASDVTIPETVKTIASNSFREFSGNAVIMGQPVIESWAFEDWSSNYNEGNIYFMNGEPAEASEYSFEDYDGRCKYNLYYLAGTEDKWTFDENGLWKGYEVKPFEASEGPEFDPEDYMASGYCGAELYGKNLAWTIDENGTLTIFGNGKMKDYEGGWDQAASEYYTTAPWNEYRYAVNKIVFEDGVTSIGSNAFYRFESITEAVVIPEGIENIGNSAFNQVGGTYIFEGSTKAIGNSAFYSWNPVANIYFLGGAPESQNWSFDNSKLYYLSGTENLWKFDENGLWNGYKVEPYTPGTAVEFDENLYVDSGYCGNDPVIENKNLAWGLDKDGTLTIFGSGKMADYTYVQTYGGGWRATTAPWFEYYESINKIVINSGVTSIGSYAFFNLEYVKEMPEIPSSVKDIGAYAFSGIYINGDLTIPEGVEKIGEWAFTGRGLKTVNIPSTLTDFVPDTFFGTVEKFVVSNNNPAFCSIDGVVFTKDKKTLYMVPDSVSGEYTVPDGTVTIGEYAFEYTNYSCVILPESVKYVGAYAFRGADVSVVVNGVLNNIGNSAFGAWENNIINVYFMNGAPISVVNGAFESDNTGKVNLYYLSGTENLWNFDSNGLWKGYEVKPYTKNPDVDLGNAWGTIGKGYCGGEPGGKNLGWIIDRNGKLTIKGKGAMANYAEVQDANGNWVSSAPWIEYNSKIKSLAFEEGITEIGSFAFFYLNPTTSLTLPSSLKMIGNYAFADSKFTGSLTVPSSVTHIGDGAFGYCNGLTGTLTVSSAYIGNRAFEGNYGSNFNNVVISQGVQTIGFRTFAGISVETITIPASVKTIDNQAFAFTQLKNINVAEENKFYCSVDGVLFTEDKTVLVQFPLGRTGEYIIPEGTETIGSSAFFNADVTDITVPESVKTLESMAFYNVLGRVCIEGQLDYLGAAAFRVYSGEVSVYFCDGETKGIGIGNESSDDGPFVIGGDGKINVYYDIANKDKWTFDENGLWNGYEIKSNYRTGDVNGDYVIDVKDVYLTRLIAAKLIEVSDLECYAADVDGNEKINVIDANLIRKFALNIISVFPA